jgi:hypothetical protein
VRGAAYVGAAHGLGMTAQAVVQDFPWSKLGESYDRGLAAPSLNVRLARTMAAFAAGFVGWFLSGSNTLIVRVFVKIGPDVRMASAAYVTADEGGGNGLGSQRKYTAETQRD